MNTNKKFRTSVVITMIGTTVYAIYLLILSHYGKLPVEEKLLLSGTSSYWTIPLSFKVSYFWNLLLGAVITMLLAYCYNQNEIVGREPYNGNKNVEDKHMTRTSVFVATSASMGIGIGTIALNAIISPWGTEYLPGPLAGLIWGLISFISLYVVCGIWIAAFEMIETDYCDDRSLTEKYSSRFTKYVKLGIVKTFPLALGLTIGFIIRITFDGVVKFFGSIKISFKKEAVN